MKPYLTDIPFLERHRAEILEVTAAFRKVREAAEVGDTAKKKQFYDFGMRVLDRLEALYEQEKKQNEKK